MNRSAAVTVIAVLSLLGSAFVLLIGIFGAGPSLAPVPNSSGPPGSPAFFKVILWGLRSSTHF